MVTLILGRQNTGKSQHYEKILEKEKNRIYFATLWHDKSTHNKIINHKNRRDENWAVLESIGDVNLDIKNIKDSLSNINTPQYCMIDGLINWVLNCSVENKFILKEVQNLSNAIINLFNEYKSVNWFLLDNLPDDYKKTPILIEASNLLKERLLLEVEDIRIIYWGLKDENFVD